MRLAEVLASAAGVLMACGAAKSSDEVVRQIAMPIMSGAAGLSIVDVPLLIWGDPWASPAGLVPWTAAEAYFKTSLGLEDRNVAARMWIKIQGVWPSRPSDPGSESARDTLRVTMDISAIPRESPRPLGGPPDAALEATLNCMIINAGRDLRKPGHLDVQVEGRSGFERLTGVYRLQPVPAPEEWNEALWRLRKESSN